MVNKKIAGSIAQLVLGILLIYIGGFVFNSIEMKKISGIFIGIGAGLSGVSIGQIATVLLTRKHPDLLRKKEIEVKDERNIQMLSRAKAKAFDSMGIIFGILMLIYVLTDAEMHMILLLVGAYLLVYGIYIFHLNRVMNEE